MSNQQYKKKDTNITIKDVEKDIDFTVKDVDKGSTTLVTDTILSKTSAKHVCVYYPFAWRKENADSNELTNSLYIDRYTTDVKVFWQCIWVQIEIGHARNCQVIVSR